MTTISNINAGDQSLNEKNNGEMHNDSQRLGKRGFYGNSDVATGEPITAGMSVTAQVSVGPIKPVDAAKVGGGKALAVDDRSKDFSTAAFQKQGGTRTQREATNG